MKTTLDLPVELVREMKIRAAQEGRKIKDIATSLLLAGMSMQSSGIHEPRPRKGSLHFPLFENASNAPAQRMTVEDILEVTQTTQSQEDNEKLGQTF